MKAWFELRKALWGVSPMRDAVDQLETAMRNREEAKLKAEQARFDAAANELNVEHQDAKIKRLLEDIRSAAQRGQLSKGELKLVRPLAGDLTARPTEEPAAPPPITAARTRPARKAQAPETSPEARLEGMSDSQFSSLGRA